MIKFGFSGRDVVRSAWVFGAAFVTAFGAIAYGPVKDALDKCAAVASQATVCDWSGAKVAVVAGVFAAVPAGIIAVKNFVFADGSAAKG